MLYPVPADLAMPDHAVLPAYAELHCLSNYSFLRGASSPDDLVRRAAVLSYSGLAITDECSFSGVVRAHVAAKAVGLPLIIGTEIRLTDDTRLVLLATDRDSYGNLSELITKARRDKRGFDVWCVMVAPFRPGPFAVRPRHPRR